MTKLVKTKFDEITFKIIGSAMEVHNLLGPGLKEEMYQRAMEDALKKTELNFEPQKQVDVYNETRLLGLLFIDILVENLVVVELKALSHPVTNNELAQVITYLKANDNKIGLLINFGRKFLEYKRIFPPRKVSKFNEKGLRFGVRILSTDRANG